MIVSGFSQVHPSGNTIVSIFSFIYPSKDKPLFSKSVSKLRSLIVRLTPFLSNLFV